MTVLPNIQGYLCGFLLTNTTSLAIRLVHCGKGTLVHAAKFVLEIKHFSKCIICSNFLVFVLSLLVVASNCRDACLTNKVINTYVYSSDMVLTLQVHSSCCISLLKPFEHACTPCWNISSSIYISKILIPVFLFLLLCHLQFNLIFPLLIWNNKEMELSLATFNLIWLHLPEALACKYLISPEVHQHSLKHFWHSWSLNLVYMVVAISTSVFVNIIILF